jgi:phosphatidate cytidylyltransferase
MLGWRLTMSAILIPLFIALFWADNWIGPRAPIFFALCMFLALRCAWELVLLLRPRFPEVRFSRCALCIVPLIIAAWPQTWVLAGPGEGPVGSIAIVFAGCMLALFALQAAAYRRPGRSMEVLGAELLVVVYLGVLLAITAQLRWVRGAELGYLVLGSMVIATKMGDTGAYTFGRLFGKRKMAPHLSPGKTWAGFVGALGGAGLGAWAWLQFATPLFDSTREPPAWYWSIVYGVLVGLAGLVGDLCESLIKRDMGQKDAAALIPGFGGMLDLLDSILFAGPVSYLLWRILPL